MIRRPRPARVIVVLVVLVAVGAAGGWWLAHRGDGDGPAVASGAMEATTYQVAAAAPGTVTQVAVQEGARVTSGQVLVSLDPRPSALAVAQAARGVDAATAGVEGARDGGTDAEVKAAQARVKQAEAALALARVQAGYAQVRAPHDGVVTTVSTNAGQAAAPGRTLVTLIDPVESYARVFVPEPRLSAVQVGAAARISADGVDARPGTVTFVASSPQFAPGTVQTADQRATLVFEVRVRPDDPAGLAPGLPVQVSFP